MTKSALDIASAERCYWQITKLVKFIHSCLSSDYDKVKEHIFKAYELVPEAYRQKVRNCRKKLTRRLLNLLDKRTII